MKFLGFFTSLINIASWWDEAQSKFNEIANTVKLLLPALGAAFVSLYYMIIGFLSYVAYSLLNWSYSIFVLIATMNTNTLSNYISGLVDRINAVIIVIVVYNFATTIISYMSKPEKAKERGVTFLKNIFVTAALLISYNLIFGLFNEVSIIVLGNKTDYDFPILSQIMDVDTNNDQGLISRFVFGSKDSEDLGSKISCGISESYVSELGEHDSQMECTGDYSFLASASSAYDTAFCEMTSCDSEEVQNSLFAGKRRMYSVAPYGFLGIIIAGFMAYFVLKACVDLGVRMFKLMLLQIAAPLPIVSILTDGFENENSRFRKYISAYFATYVEVFIRLFVMFVVSAFIINFLDIIGSFVPAVDNSTNEDITRLAIKGILCVSAFFFLNYAPAFIDGALGTNMASSMGAIGDGILGAGFAGAAAIKNAWANNKTKKDKDGKETLNSPFKRVLNAAHAGLSGIGAGYQNASGAQNKGNSIRDLIGSYSKLTENAYETGINTSNDMIDRSNNRKKRWNDFKESVAEKRQKLFDWVNGTNGDQSRLDELQAAKEKAEADMKDFDRRIEMSENGKNATAEVKVKAEQTKAKVEADLTDATKQINLADAKLKANAEATAKLDLQQAAVNKVNAAAKVYESAVATAQATYDQVEKSATATYDKAVSDANQKYDERTANINKMVLSDADKKKAIKAAENDRDTAIQTAKSNKDKTINAAKATYDKTVSDADDVLDVEVEAASKNYKAAGGRAVDSNGRLLVGQAVDIINDSRSNVVKSDTEATVIKTNSESIKTAKEAELNKINSEIDGYEKAILQFDQDINGFKAQKKNYTIEVNDYGDNFYDSKLDDNDPRVKFDNPNLEVKLDAQGNKLKKQITIEDLNKGLERSYRYTAKLQEEDKKEREAIAKRNEEADKSAREADTKKYTEVKKYKDIFKK